MYFSINQNYVRHFSFIGSVKSRVASTTIAIAITPGNVDPVKSMRNPAKYGAVKRPTAPTENRTPPEAPIRSANDRICAVASSIPI